MITAIVIDDESPARELIKVYLQGNNEVELTGEAADGFEGVKMINELKPDLIFLDIQMPKINGFELLELLESSPAIIFCTAFDEFAIRAFEKSATDYLLKPFSKERFLEAINKVFNRDQSHGQYLAPSPADYHRYLTRVVVKNNKSIDIVDVNDIEFIEAQDDYSEIHIGSKKMLKQRTMAYFEKALDPTIFVRVHRRFIANVNFIEKIDRLGKETYMAVLKTGKTISISNAGYRRLKSALDI